MDDGKGANRMCDGSHTRPRDYRQVDKIFAPEMQGSNDLTRQWDHCLDD